MPPLFVLLSLLPQTAVGKITQQSLPLRHLIRTPIRLDSLAAETNKDRACDE